MDSQASALIENTLEDALRVAMGAAKSPLLAEVITETLAALRRPIRVAVVGLIKAGKSTLLNAILGEPLLPTGTTETTYTVGVIKWCEQRTLRVFFKGGRPPETYPFTSLGDVIKRGTDLAFLQSVEYVEIGYPNALLRNMTLVDTPGLGSTHGADSENTRAFLKIREKEIVAASKRELAGADAVLYVFSKSIHEYDQKILGELQGAAQGRASPLNSIGILSKVDLYWPDAEPLDGGMRVARRLSGHPQSRRLLYDVIPVAGLPAFGARQLGREEINALQSLSSIRDDVLLGLLNDENRFVSATEPQNLPEPLIRIELLEKLGIWGIWYIARKLRTSPAAGLESSLWEASGIERVRLLLQNHFGNRARMIVANSALPKLKEALFLSRKQVHSDSASNALSLIGAGFEKMLKVDTELQYMRVLQDLYHGDLDVNDDEREQILSITGEHGVSTSARARVNELCGTVELMRSIDNSIGYWNAIAAGCDGRTGRTLEAARIVARSFEKLAQEVGRSGT